MIKWFSIIVYHFVYVFILGGGVPLKINSRLKSFEWYQVDLIWDLICFPFWFMFCFKFKVNLFSRNTSTLNQVLFSCCFSIYIDIVWLNFLIEFPVLLRKNFNILSIVLSFHSLISIINQVKSLMKWFHTLYVKSTWFDKLKWCH